MKNQRKYPPWHRLLLFVIVLVVVIELILRFAFGFGNIPVYYASAQFEYALKPSQEMTRFGNKYFINSDGMRSAPLGSKELRILKFGDSVLNGGIAADQNEIASTILENRFFSEGSEQKVRILNVSAGSWGPDNAFAWMSRHGDFDAVGIVLLFSSHDWQDQMSFEDVVGNIPFYPEEKPAFAMADAIHWIYSRYFQVIAWNDLPKIDGGVADQQSFNPGWERFITYTRAESIPLIVYHHANLEEIENQEWTEEGKQLEVYLAGQGVDVISGLDAGFDVSDFRDMIHPNKSGQVKIADALEPVLSKLIGRVR